MTHGLLRHRQTRAGWGRHGAALAVVWVCLFVSVPLAMWQPVLPPVPWNPTDDPLWRTPIETIGSPALIGDAVFALRPDHRLVKLSAADGSVEWDLPTGESGSTGGRRVVAAGDVVLVGEFEVAGFDVITGRRRWQYTPREGHAFGIFLGDIDRDLILTGSGSGHLAALYTADGRERWVRAIASPKSSVYEPRVAGDLVFAAYTDFTNSPLQGGVVAVSLSDGAERWRFTFPENGRDNSRAGGPVVTDRYVIAGGNDGRVFVLNRETGREEWVIPPLQGPLDSIIPAGSPENRALVVNGRTLAVGSVTGYITGFDLDTRREIWRFPGGQLGSTAWDFAAMPGTVLISYMSGFLVALDSTTGELLWRTNDYRQGFHWSPAMAPGRLFLAGREGVWAVRSSRPTP
ncbi:MAG: PQQ-binding-like beta-propeller repeat protein [Acidobacteria bacterium]|nr:PQQ-binding-like beta-propeller repeat protein [Acidobacteriota bacterium]